MIARQARDSLSSSSAHNWKNTGGCGLTRAGREEAANLSLLEMTLGGLTYWSALLDSHDGD